MNWEEVKKAIDAILKRGNDAEIRRKGDGLDTGEPEELARELAWLKRHTRRLLWLNPLLRFDGYAATARGAAELHRAADGMLAVHNLSALQTLGHAIAALIQQ